MPEAPRRPALLTTRRALRTTALGFVLVVGTLAFLTARWFIWPQSVTSRPGTADAVVMFGGAGPRYAEALRLAGAGAGAGEAPWLVLSDPRDPDQVWTAYGAFCQEQHPYRTVCFDPEPKTTRGEARFVADLAQRQGWSRLLLVTTTEQASRAKRLVERCWDGQVQVVGVSSGRSRPLRVVYEWGATVRAALFRPGC